MKSRWNLGETNVTQNNEYNVPPASDFSVTRQVATVNAADDYISSAACCLVSTLPHFGEENVGFPFTDAFFIHMKRLFLVVRETCIRFFFEVILWSKPDWDECSVAPSSLFQTFRISYLPKAGWLKMSTQYDLLPQDIA